jgi:Mce-associated membrane protein
MTAAATEPTQNHSESAVTASPAPSRPQTLIIALGVLIVVSAVVVGLLAWQSIGDAHTRVDRADALAAARTGATEVLSFDPANLNAQLATARKIVSGTFAAEFEQMSTAVITPATKQLGLTTKAEVIRAAVIDSQLDQADVLLFVKQTTSTKSQPQVKSVTNQMQVTMTKSDDGQWLVSNLQPL